MKFYNDMTKDNQPIPFETLPTVHTGNLSKSQSEIVNKFSELVDYTAANPGIPLEATARALAFSESSIATASKYPKQTLAQGLQFADSALTPVVGNTTFAPLAMLIQEIGSTIEPALLSMAFPDLTVPQYNVIVERIARNSGILPEFAGYNAPLPTAKILSTYALQYRNALYAARVMIGARDIFFERERGNVSLGARGLGQMVSYNMVNLVTQAMTRKNYLLNQSVFANGFTFAGESISSNIPTGNYIAMDSMGTLNVSTGRVTYTNADPLYNPLNALQEAILANPNFLIYRQYVKAILMNGQDLIALMNHPAVKATTNFLIAAGQSLGNKNLKLEMNGLTKEITGYYAPSFEFPLIADNSVWIGQDGAGNGDLDAQSFFVPRGSMYIMLDLPQGSQAGAFHLTYNEVDPNIEAPSMGLFSGVFSRNLGNSDVTNRLDLVCSLAGAPAVYMPEAQLIVTKLYSNI